MKHNPTDVKNVKKLHQEAAQILAALEFFSRQQHTLIESAKTHKSVFGTIPNLWNHRIEIYDLCQERMAERYCNLISKLLNNDF